MTTLLTRLAWFSVRRRRLVLALSALFVVVAAGLGAGAFGALKGGGFDDPGSESSRSADTLEAVFDTGEPNLVLLVRSSTGSIDDPASAGAGLALTERLAGIAGVADVVSYWTLDRASAMRNESGDEALVLGGSPPKTTRPMRRWRRSATNSQAGRAPSTSPSVDQRR